MITEYVLHNFCFLNIYLFANTLQGTPHLYLVLEIEFLAKKNPLACQVVYIQCDVF